MKESRLRVSAPSVAVVVGVFVGATLSAQQAGPAARVQAAPSTPEAYGVSALNVYSVSGTSMVPEYSFMEYAADSGDRRITLNGTGTFVASVVIPSGAFVTGIQLEACDTNAAAEVYLALRRCPTAGGAASCTTIASVTTGTVATFQCGLYLSTTSIVTPTIDHDNFRYDLWAVLTSSTGISLGAARISWRRQVSPAPAFASFADVPVGHPFHRFVQALFASGITGGCGGGNYCPDAPLTRGQMAVFLAGALGLHWPNKM
jgi:hypothetical protein